MHIKYRQVTRSVFLPKKGHSINVLSVPRSGLLIHSGCLVNIDTMSLDVIINNAVSTKHISRITYLTQLICFWTGMLEFLYNASFLLSYYKPMPSSSLGRSCIKKIKDTAKLSKMLFLPDPLLSLFIYVHFSEICLHLGTPVILVWLFIFPFEKMITEGI